MVSGSPESGLRTIRPSRAIIRALISGDPITFFTKLSASYESMTIDKIASSGARSNCAWT